PVPKTITSGSLTLTVQPKPPTALQVTSGGPGAAFLQWVGSASGDVAGYRVYRGTSPGVHPIRIDVNSPSVNTFTDSNLGSGTYFYVVSAVSNTGIEGPVSNEVSIVIP